MSSFFGGQSTSSTNSGGTNQPAWAGVYTTDQSKNQTGGTQTQAATAGGAAPQGGAQPSAAPASGGAAGAQPQQQGASAQQQAKSAGPVDFSQFLAANQQGVQNQTNQTTGSASSAASQLGQAATAFTQSAQAASAVAPQATAFTGSTAADIQAATTNPSSYTGPTASSLSNSQLYQAQQYAQQRAAQQAQALKNGGSQQNAYDAAAQKASGAAKQQTLGAEQNLANTQSAASQAVQQGLGAAQGAQQKFNNTVSSNLQQIGNVVSTDSAAAAAQKQGAQSTASAITGALAGVKDAKSFDSTVSQYTEQLQAMGFSPQDIATIENDVNNGSYGVTEAVKWLSDQVGQAAPEATGYTAQQAAAVNAGNAALGNGGAQATTGSYTSSGATATVNQQAGRDETAIQSAKQTLAPYEQQRQQEIAKLTTQNIQNGMTPQQAAQQAQMMEGGLQNYSGIDNAVGYLSANGMSTEEIANALGFQPGSSDYNQFVQHYNKYSNNVQQTYQGDVGQAYDPTQSSQLYGKV